MEKKLHNVKTISKKLFFLSEHRMKDYDELSKVTTEVKGRFASITSRQMEIIFCSCHYINGEIIENEKYVDKA